MAGTDWTDAEIQASVDAYFELLAYEQANAPYIARNRLNPAAVLVDQHHPPGLLPCHS
jgi:hypothetical protein